MKYKYTGADKDQTIREVTFVKGKPVEVDVDLAQKLENHPDYQSVRRKSNADKK